MMRKQLPPLPKMDTPSKPIVPGDVFASIVWFLPDSEIYDLWITGRELHSYPKLWNRILPRLQLEQWHKLLRALPRYTYKLMGFDDGPRFLINRDEEHALGCMACHEQYGLNTQYVRCNLYEMRHPWWGLGMIWCAGKKIGDISFVYGPLLRVTAYFYDDDNNDNDDDDIFISSDVLCIKMDHNGVYILEDRGRHLSSSSSIY